MESAGEKGTWVWCQASAGDVEIFPLPHLPLCVHFSFPGLLDSKLDYILSLLAAGGPLHTTRSILIFCAFRHDADLLAARLHARSYVARSYHAGKHPQERQKLEAAFLQGSVRIIVATVAFGMGIDLPGIGAIIHASMPRSLEEYVQQIGRAGRNGDEALCFAIVDDAEYCLLRARCLSGRAPRRGVRTLLERLFGRWQDSAEKVGKGGSGAVFDDGACSSLSEKAWSLLFK